MQSFFSSAVLLHKRDKVPSLGKLWMLRCSEQPPGRSSSNRAAFHPPHQHFSERRAGNEGLAESLAGAPGRYLQRFSVCRHSKQFSSKMPLHKNFNVWMKFGHVKHGSGTRKRLLLWQTECLSELHGLALENPNSFSTAGKETAAKSYCYRWCSNNAGVLYFH